VAARRVLADADVVLYDRLAPHEDLKSLTLGAELVDVGKLPGHHPMPQGEIEALMVRRARLGETVVRLKGGDPFVFGRGGEEVAAAVAAGIPVSVVPGVTSALAVPAAAGIPVTHRAVARMFTVVSGHVPLSDRECRSLVDLGGALVVLMGMATVFQLAAGLLRAGMPESVRVAVVEKGFSSEQVTTSCSLGELDAVVREAGCSSPAVVVVGEVVRLGDSWRLAAAAGERAGMT